MSKHTEGPWEIDRFGNLKSPHGTGPLGMVVFHGLALSCGSEAEHNTVLISAAPDLLEALEGVVRVADRATQEFDAARAAIAKAKGEQQC